MLTLKVLKNISDCMPRPRLIRRRFGLGRLRVWIGSNDGTRCLNGTSRLRNGLSAARSISRTTASTVISKRGGEQGRHHLGRRARRAANADVSGTASEVCRFANVLKTLGVKTGDRVALYMPLVPELAIAMLACARIGATHTVIFGGFSADAIRDRVNDGGCKLIVTADGGYRRGNEVKLKAASTKPLSKRPTVENVIVFKRTGTNVTWNPAATTGGTS